MAWSEKKELTAGQIAAAQIAGIPADREGLGGEYPKAVYREGKGPQLLGEPFKIGGLLIDTATVANLEEEMEAIEEGWFLTPDLRTEERKRDELRDAQAEIEALKAQLAGQAGGEPVRRGPGRPPRNADADPTSGIAVELLRASQ